MGCLVRSLGAFAVLIVLLVGLRRLTETPVAMAGPGSGERDFVVDGVRWRSRESPGGPAYEPVVYVHGFLSSSATWKRVLSRASAGRTAIAVDLPGSGYSDRPWPYDFTVYGQAQHLLRYLEARGIAHAVLVGNSLGGAVCEVAAAARPEQISGLVLVDAASPETDIPLGFRLLRTPVAGEIQMELLVRPVMEFTLRHRLYARAERVTAETVDDWWRPIAVKGTRRAGLEAVRTNTRAASGVLANIRVPTAVVWGKEDSLLPASEGRRLAGRIGGAVYLEIPGAGHLPQEEMPEEFGRAVSGFLRTLPNGGASGARF